MNYKNYERNITFITFQVFFTTSCITINIILMSIVKGCDVFYEQCGSAL